MFLTLNEVATLVDATIIGNGEIVIKGLSAIDQIKPEHIVFAENEYYLDIAQQSQASAIIVPEGVTQGLKPLLVVKNPAYAFAKLIEKFFPKPRPQPSIHPSAIIADDVELGANLHIGPRVVIESGCKIGEHTVIKAGTVIGSQVSIGSHCLIHANVTLYDDCQIGNEVQIHSGAVIGADGFGYTAVENRHHKIPHVGNVVIEDQVEIGANTVIDRANMTSTRIGQGTKIDNLVQIAHSVELGPHNILCAFTGIAGSTKTGSHVVCAANVGISDHVEIGDRVILGARTGVAPKKRLAADTVWLGNPARSDKKTIEQIVALQRLPNLIKRVSTLQQQVNAIEKKEP